MRRYDMSLIPRVVKSAAMRSASGRGSGSERSLLRIGVDEIEGEAFGMGVLILVRVAGVRYQAGGW